MSNKQLARGIHAGFSDAENPFAVPNGMEENLRLIDDHLSLYTLEEPQPPGTALPLDPADGAGQIYTNGSYCVFNGGIWKSYRARYGQRVALANGVGNFFWSDPLWVYDSGVHLAAAQAAQLAAEAARDAAIIQSGVYVDEPSGRAAVADGQAFKVQGSGLVAAFEYRRINAGASELIASYPSSTAIERFINAPVEVLLEYSQALLNAVIQPSAADPRVAFSVMASDGRSAPLVDSEGRTLTTRNGVTSPVSAEEDVGGVAGPCQGSVDGQALLELQVDTVGDVVRGVTDGGLLTVGSKGLYRYTGRVYQQGHFCGILNGERPIFVELNAFDEVIEVFTLEGGHYKADQGRLIRIGEAKALTPAVTASGRLAVFNVETTLANPARDDTVYGVLVNGQSNAYGSSNGHGDTQPPGFPAWSQDPVIASVPRYPANALMLPGYSPRQFGACQAFFVPLRESRDATGFGGETVASSMVNHMLASLDNAHGAMPCVAAAVCAIGSQLLMDLKQGRPAYNQSLAAVEAMMTAAKREGKTYIHKVTVWIQGESDNEVYGATRSPLERVSALKAYRRNLHDDIKRLTGQTEDIIALEVQIASGIDSLTSSDGPFRQSVRNASVLLDQQDTWRLAATMYAYPTSGNGPNQIHLSCRGYNLLGQALARSALTEWLGNGWTGFKPEPDSIRWVSNTAFDIDFIVPSMPIVIDTTGSVIDMTGLTARGFFFDDRTGASPIVLSVATQGGRSLRITLDKAPAAKNCRLAYAMRATGLPPAGEKGPYGPIYGMRGCIRDSAGHTNIYDASVQHNWLAAFSIPVTY